MFGRGPAEDLPATRQRKELVTRSLLLLCRGWFTLHFFLPGRSSHGALHPLVPRPLRCDAFFREGFRLNSSRSMRMAKGPISRSALLAAVRFAKAGSSRPRSSAPTRTATSWADSHMRMQGHAHADRLTRGFRRDFELASIQWRWFRIEVHDGLSLSGRVPMQTFLRELSVEKSLARFATHWCGRWRHILYH